MACEDGGGIVLSVAEVDPKTRFPRFLLFSYHLPPTCTFFSHLIPLSATYHIIHPVKPGIGQQYRVSAPAR